jgi:hypothetical protein
MQGDIRSVGQLLIVDDKVYKNTFEQVKDAPQKSDKQTSESTLIFTLIVATGLFIYLV